MNKYEVLFSDIFEKTESGEIKWRQIRKDAHSDLIFNPNLSYRQYSGTYRKNDETYEVVFVEKKADDPEHDFVYEKYIPEILVIGEGNELLVTLTDSVIDRSEMINLVKEIEETNDKTKKLLD